MPLDMRKVKSWWLVLLQLSASWLFVVAQLNGEESSEPAHIIFVEWSAIMKMNLDGTGVEMIHNSGGFRVAGLDYHHRLNTVYWISHTQTGMFSFLYKRSLDPKKDEGFQLMRSIRGHAAGIAIDWINDKAYLTVDHKIVEVDLNTNSMTDIVTLTGTPLGIGVFPHRNNSWLYFTEKDRRGTGDSKKSALVRMPAVRGGTQTILNERNIECPNAITMDYPNVNVYWNDACNKQIEVIRIDGTRHNRIYDGNDMVSANTHSAGIAYYNGIVYWTDTQRIFRFNTTTSTTERFYAPPSEFADGIRIVHSSLQPTEDQLQLYETCTSIECIHGQCISNVSLCACDPGWSGDACDQDINECEVNNGGCEEICINTAGSFLCKCHEGQTLESNKRNCSNANSPAPVSVTPMPSSQPTSSRNPTSNPSTDPSTDSISIPSSATTSSLTPDSVTRTESNAMTSSSSSESTNTVPTVSSTDDNEKTPEQPTLSGDYDPAKTVSSTDDNEKKPEQPTSPDDYDPAKTTPSQQLRPSPTPSIFGLKPNAKQPESPPNLLIIIVSTATATVVLVSIFCYIIFLYCKLSRKRRGSYDVNKRKRAHDLESGTSSTRSSFRAVSEHHYSPNLENQFLRQILPGSTSSMSEESTTAISVAPATSSESMSASSSAANESSAESESQPLRLDSCNR